MDLQAVIMLLLSDFPILTTLIATLVFGEEIVIILGFLSGIGLLSLWILFVFGLIGTFLSDLLWFTIGKYFFTEKRKKISWHKHYHRFMKYLDRASHGNDFLALLFTRFFYFFRIFALMHIGGKDVSFRRFFIYEIPVITIWLGIFISLGWFFGSVALVYFEIFADFQKILGIILIMVFVFIVFKGVMQRIFERD